jgi:hypothetical protein
MRKQSLVKFAQELGINASFFIAKPESSTIISFLCDSSPITMRGFANCAFLVLYYAYQLFFILFLQAKIFFIKL